MIEVTRLLEFLCQKPTQRQDEARLSVTNSDKQLSHREVNQTFKKKKSFFVNVPKDPTVEENFAPSAPE